MNDLIKWENYKAFCFSIDEETEGRGWVSGTVALTISFLKSSNFSLIQSTPHFLKACPYFILFFS